MVDGVARAPGGDKGECVLKPWRSGEKKRRGSTMDHGRKERIPSRRHTLGRPVMLRFSTRSRLTHSATHRSTRLTYYWLPTCELHMPNRGHPRSPNRAVGLRQRVAHPACNHAMAVDGRPYRKLETPLYSSRNLEGLSGAR